MKSIPQGFTATGMGRTQELLSLRVAPRSHNVGTDRVSAMKSLLAEVGFPPPPKNPAPWPGAAGSHQQPLCLAQRTRDSHAVRPISNPGTRVTSPRPDQGWLQQARESKQVHPDQMLKQRMTTTYMVPCLIP